MKHKHNSTFFIFKVIAVLAVFVGAGFAVYLSSLNIGQPAELLGPIPMPELADSPSGSLPTKILMYHHIRSTKIRDYYSVSPQVFEEQLQWLKNSGYTVVSYSAFYRALTTTSTLPEKSVVITFDDGYRDQYSQALPILQKFGYPAIFFPYTRDIGKRAFMTWDMLRALQAAGMEIGSHSVSHPRMDRLDERDLMWQTRHSKEVLQKELGREVEHFCYPYGLYSYDVVRSVVDAGYLSAVTVRTDLEINKKDGPYFVPRARVDNNLEALIAIVSR